MAKNTGGLWKGRKLIQDGDADSLESLAAVKEFRDGLPRDAAEEKAYREYRGNHHEDARAHHYAGMKAALAVGDHEAAQKHGQLYDLHTVAAGKDPMAGVDSEVMARLEANKGKHYKFKAHKGDGFLVHDHQEAVAKSEDLAKGKLLQFPQDRVAPGQDQGQDAKVVGQIDSGRVASASRPFEGKQSLGDTMAGVASKDPAVLAAVARMKQTGERYVSLKGGKMPTYQHWTAPLGRHLADSHGNTPLDSRGIHEVAGTVASKFGVPYDDAAMALDKFRGRHLGSNEDLGHVAIELGRELTAMGHLPPALRKDSAIGDGTTDVSPGSVSND